MAATTKKTAAKKPATKKDTAKKTAAKKPATKKDTASTPATNGIDLTAAIVVVTTRPLSQDKGGDVTLTRKIGVVLVDGARNFVSVSDRDGGKPGWFSAVSKICSSPKGVESIAEGLRIGETLYVQPIDPKTGQPCMLKDDTSKPLMILLGTIVSIEQAA